MEIDAKKVRTETRPLPPNELVVTPETLDRLKVPDEIALRPENVIPFLASQSVRYNEIVNRPEIKTLEAEIPSYTHEESVFANQRPLVSVEEQAALASWMREKVLGIQSESDVDPLLREIDGYVQDTLKNNPGLSLQRGGAMDPMEMMMTDRMTQDTEEERKRFWEALAAAKGNAEAVNTVMGYHYASQLTKKIGKLMAVYKNHVEDMDKLAAQFDLKNQKGPLSAADLAKYNSDFARSQTDTSNLFQMINKAVGDYQRISENTSRINGDIKRPLEVMIQNMKT